MCVFVDPEMLPIQEQYEDVVESLVNTITQG